MNHQIPMSCHYIVYCPRNLESVLAQEIQTLCQRPVKLGQSHVRFSGSLQDAYRLNLHSRVASRVLLSLANARATTEDAIYRLAYEIDWTRWFTADKTIRVRVEGHHSAFRSFNFLALKIKDAICDRFRDSCGKRPSVDKAHAQITIYLYLNRDNATLYLDSSGESLFKRGWRKETGIAPLRENLAAGLLLLAAYDGSQPFFDPMAGSGTIAIEAASIASHRAPGLLRHFAFEHWQNFDKDTWQALRQAASDAIIAPPQPIFASDQSAELIAILQQNAKNAQVADWIDARVATFDATTKAPCTTTGLMLMNPPYGERLGEQQAIRAQYPNLGRALKQAFVGWQVGFVSADETLPSGLRLSPKRKPSLYNGAISCRLYLFDMVAGAHRRRTNLG